MKILDIFKVFLVAVLASWAWVSCGDDEEIGDGIPVPEYRMYEGSCIVCGLQGENQTEIFRDTIESASASLVTLNNELVAFMTVDVKNLYIPQTRMTINLPPYSIDGFNITGETFSISSYKVDDVPCSINGREGIYSATGKLSGKYLGNNEINVVYDLALGAMPLKIQMEFKGVIKQ